MPRRKRLGCLWRKSNSIFDILKTIPFWFYTLEVNMTWSVFFLLPGHGNKWPKNKVKCVFPMVVVYIIWPVNYSVIGASIRELTSVHNYKQLLVFLLVLVLLFLSLLDILQYQVWFFWIHDLSKLVSQPRDFQYISQNEPNSTKPMYKDCDALLHTMVDIRHPNRWRHHHVR